MKKLKDILNGVSYTILKGTNDLEIKNIKYDSRKIEENDLYIALIGFTSDGHDYVSDAIKKGAKVIIISKIMEIEDDVTVIKVDDTRLTLAYISKNYFDDPASQLTLIAVTGTTGKTTTTHMIRDILLSGNIKCGLIGSQGIKYNDLVIPTDNTTPESYEVHKAFREMLDHGITHVVMEASSQAFKLNRLAGIIFDLGVLTNVTTDHIAPGEHESHEEYVACKNKLFLNSREIISNNDSLYLKEVLKGVEVPITTYSITSESDLKVTNVKLINDNDFFGSEFTTKGIINDTFRTCMPGDFNVYNSICAILVCYKLGVSIKTAKESLKTIKVRGRMETALVTPKYKVLIDHAHTEDGMKGLVRTLRAYNPKRLVSIFGGGGNRPKERRYNLGEIIGGASDLCIITMDNPRFEEIESINKDIKVGLDKVGAKYIEIPDRADAIKYACENALDGDLILLVGKGHEEYQDIKGVKYYFNELDVIDEIKKNLK